MWHGYSSFKPFGKEAQPTLAPERWVLGQGWAQAAKQRWALRWGVPQCGLREAPRWWEMDPRGQCGGESSGGKGPGVRWRDAASTRTRSSGTYILGGSYKTEGLKQVEEKWK